MNLEICFVLPAFTFSTLSFFHSDQRGISPWRSSLTRDNLHLGRCNGINNGINNICNLRLYDTEGLNKFFTGVFSDIPFCNYLSLNICVHGDSTLKENTGIIRESNISHHNLRDVQTLRDD